MILSRKRFDRSIDDAIKGGIEIGRRDGRVQASIDTLTQVRAAIEAEHRDTTAEHAAASTRWEKRRLQGRLEALEIVSADLLEVLEALES